MNSFKKLCAMVLAIMMIISCFSTTILSVAAEETATEPTITESATEFLYNQAYNGAIKEGETTPTKSNNRIAITQNGPWRVAGKRPDGSTYNDVTGFWYRKTDSLDMRYGYSTWSYTTPFIGPAFKDGDTSKKVLSAQLRPNSTADGDRKNAFMELYYIAEATGDYNVSDGIGGFSVRESAASNYQVTVTVLANGIEIFKSQPLNRVNRIARFKDQKVSLNKGDKLEYRFEYVTTANTFSGDIIIDFDPVVTLLEQKEVALPTLAGASATDLFYDELYNSAPTFDTENSVETYNTPITQSKAWRAEYFENSQWNEMVYYTNGGPDDEDPTKPENYTHYMNWTYNSTPYSNTQASFIGVGYWNYSIDNGKTLRAMLTPEHSSLPVRISYKAEYEGDYTLSMLNDSMLAIDGALTDCAVSASVTVNGKAKWTSSAIAAKGDSIPFNALSFKLNKGDVLAIEFKYTLNEGVETGSGSITIDFIPQLSISKVYPAVSGDGNVTSFFYDELYNKAPTGGTTYDTPITQTKPWRAEYYSSGWKEMTYFTNGKASEKDSSKPETNTHYLNWTYNPSKWSNTQSSFISVRYWKTNVNNPTTLTAKLYPGYESSNVRVSYESELDGEYLLSMLGGVMRVTESTISGCKAYAYVTVNGKAVWTSPEIKTEDQEIDFEDLKIKLLKGDVLGIEFKYLLDEGVSKGSGSIYVDFRPKFTLVKELPQLEGDGEVAEVLYNALDKFDAVGTNKSVKTAQNSIWRMQYYSSSKWSDLTHLSNHSKSTSASSLNWGFDRGSYSQHARISVRWKNSTVAKGKHLVIEMPMQRSSTVQTRLSYTAELDGIYNLTDKFGNFIAQQREGGRYNLWVQITHNGSVLWKSDYITATGQQIPFDGVTLEMKKGDNLSIEFRYSEISGTSGYDAKKTILNCAPVITYNETTTVENKDGYTPETSTRYYAESLTVPTNISAFINTTSALPGYILNSDAFSLSIAANGNPTVTYKNGDADKQIVFPINIKGGWTKLTVSYDTKNAAWNCYINDLLISTVPDADFVSGGAIDKLYIGASNDQYNLGSFKGEIAELSLSGAENTASWSLNDITTETGLISENVAYKADHNGVGLTFKNQNSRLDLYDVCEKPVSTFEVWVKLPTDYMDNKSAGRILGNSYNFKPYSQLNIVSGGRPKLVVCDANGNTDSVTFNVDVRSDEFIHLAITVDTENGVYKCFINGILADTVESSMVIPVGLKPYLVSGDYYHNNTPVNFEGDLAGISLFTDVRTQEEIIADMYGETDLTDTELFGKWSLSDKEDGLINQNGSGIDLHPFWEKTADETVDESFGNYSTFVFIPDTQNFTQSQGSDGLDSIVNWILENKESENIVGVMGLGDITNNNSASQWKEAKTSFEKLMGQVPFTFIEGNHDIEFNNPDPNNPRNTTNFNTYFPFDTWSPYIDGYFEEGKIDNMYVLTEDVNGNKYMMLGLEFQPRDAVLEWANKVVAEHSDYNVIVTTHGYQQYNHTTKNQYHISSDSYTDVVGTDNNVGTEIWDKFVRKHANITTVVCGHVYHEDIHVTTSIGDNGNVVTEIISNAQTTDVLMRMSGTITIVRVSEDGTKANVNQYATHHNQYLKDLNQFTIDWIEGGYKTEEEPVIGDITGDGIVNAEDLNTLRIKLISNSEYDALYDVNQDGYFSVKDLVRIKKICAGIDSVGLSFTEGTVTVNEKIAIGYTPVDSDALVASGDANVTIDGGSYNGGCGAANTAVWAKENATVIINDGNFYVGADAKGDYNDLIYARDNAKVEIYGGFFESEVPWSNNGKYYVLNVRNDSNATITVYGGTFVNYNPLDGDDVVEGAITVADGYEVVSETKDNGDVWYTVVKTAE